MARSETRKRDAVPIPFESERTPVTTAEIASLVHGELLGDPARIIADVAPLDEAAANHVAYVESDKQLRRLEQSRAGAVLIGRELAAAAQLPADRTFILVDDAQRDFIDVMLRFRPRPARPTLGISSHAFVDPGAVIGPECNIHPGASVGPGAVLGARCDIHPGAVIGRHCRLGDDVVIHPNAVLYHDVTLGHRVIVHATAVIGADGFGYRFELGRFVHIPHTGTVILEDDVEIGAGTTIDRAMIGATVIGAGTKLDNQVMIAHNCRLGKHNAFASQVGLAGSVTTGDYVRCGGQVGVANHAHLGTGCTLGAKAGVSGNIPEGECYHGLPARPEKEAIKAHLAMGKLPEMRIQLRELERQVKGLTSQIATLTSTAAARAA
jgi:UDP-3-O-[3-hydroxymyristoyl] glucosamine N-acyltransferase